jgi:tellurite resistance protein TehA-like permease
VPWAVIFEYFSLSVKLSHLSRIMSCISNQVILANHVPDYITMVIIRIIHVIIHVHQHLKKKSGRVDKKLLSKPLADSSG